MYMEELATLHKTDDGKHIMMVKPKRIEGKSKGGKEPIAMPMEEPKSYVASSPDELHGLIDEHIYGKKKTKEDEYAKGFNKKVE